MTSRSPPTPCFVSKKIAKTTLGPLSAASSKKNDVKTFALHRRLPIRRRHLRDADAPLSTHALRARSARAIFHANRVAETCSGCSSWICTVLLARIGRYGAIDFAGTCVSGGGGKRSWSGMATRALQAAVECTWPGKARRWRSSPLV